MVRWLKDCFSGMISVLFVLTVLGFSVGGTLLGVSTGSLLLLFLYIFAGIVAGLVVGIATYGLLATIVNIAENQEKILLILSGEEIVEDDDEDDEEV